jgi:predicted XRE-type DNA-binding protein
MVRFAGAGVPNAEEHFVKAKLVFKIDTILKRRGLKQTEAAELFGVRQPERPVANSPSSGLAWLTNAMLR